jgi:hypothetical protein
MVVVMKDGNAYNTVDDNLEVVTRAESTRRAAAASAINLSFNYVVAQMTYKKPELREAIRQQPELVETHRQIMFLKRTIKKVKNGKQSAKSNSGSKVVPV